MRQRRLSRREIRSVQPQVGGELNSSRAFGRPPESPSTLVIRRRFPSFRPGLRNFSRKLWQRQRTYVSDIHMYGERDIRTRVRRIGIFRENSLLQPSAFYGSSPILQTNGRQKKDSTTESYTNSFLSNLQSALLSFNMITERDRAARKLVFRGLIPIPLNLPWKRIEAKHTCVTAASIRNNLRSQWVLLYNCHLNIF